MQHQLYVTGMNVPLNIPKDAADRARSTMEMNERGYITYTDEAGARFTIALQQVVALVETPEPPAAPQ